jgi:hypothetical protein
MTAADRRTGELLSMAVERLGLVIEAVEDERGVVWVERVEGEAAGPANRAAVKLFFFLRAAGLEVGEEGVLIGPPRTRFCPVGIDCSTRIRIAPY